MYVNENFNQTNVSNIYEKLQFLLIIFPVFMATKLPILLLKMNILCANFFDKSAYKVRKISLGKIIGGGGGARAPLPCVDTSNFSCLSLQVQDVHISHSLSKILQYRRHSKECMWHQQGHFYMVFNVYDSKLCA